MEIVWYGHACFRLRGKEGSVVTDPYDKTIGYHLPRLSANVVTVSHDHPGHSYVRGVRGHPKIIAGPGEYEVKGIFIFGIPAFHDRKQGKQRGRNTVYLFEFEDLTICHLGDLGHVPAQPQVEALSDIDVLLIPVGALHTLNASMAAEVINLLEPRIVVPMHYKTDVVKARLAPLRKFLKEMGLKRVKPRESLKIRKGSLPEETQVVVLEYRQ
ncbi:MAG TPA: lactamase [Anaerolineae bacterium]|nr:lactamase [Anaerolineae bacterium]